ncbi:MAG: hypothetical protein KC933_41780, partial [Myxococcales bacterium]|nr:hypothetical protein [Myxococcales bacterium]
GQYCDWPDDQCGAADVPGVCQPRPEGCAQVYDPVCGCDGMTYGNACSAAAAGMDAQYAGECRDAGACGLPADSGPCDAAFRRWYFNSESGACEAFVYGGCGGNANNFETLEACQGACGGGPDACGLPMEVGPCEAAIPRWFHNAQTGMCERFIYGGCGGNANNFETLEACEASCGGPDACGLPAEVGDCDAAIPRWFHNAQTGMCERFVYGGCGGNANNFETLEACEAACGADGPCPDQSRNPIVLGGGNSFGECIGDCVFRLTLSASAVDALGACDEAVLEVCSHDANVRCAWQTGTLTRAGHDRIRAVAAALAD